MASLVTPADQAAAHALFGLPEPAPTLPWVRLPIVCDPLGDLRDLVGGDRFYRRRYLEFAAQIREFRDTGTDKPARRGGADA